MQKENPRLQKQIEDFFQFNQWDRLTLWLERLSHKDFKVAISMLRQKYLPQLEENEFWRVFALLSTQNGKAYLNMCLNAASELKNKEKISLSHPIYQKYIKDLIQMHKEVDIEKNILSFLPLSLSPQESEALFKSFQIQDNHQKIYYLLSAGNVVNYYVLFQLLNRLDNLDYIHRCVSVLIKKKENTAFNFASILVHYHNLKNVPVIFSLQIPAYKFSSIDNSFHCFKEILFSV